MTKRPTAVLATYDSEALTGIRGELEAAGLKVVATASGLDVLKRVEKDAPDLVVIDVLLPKLNGLNVIKRIKARPEAAALRIILMIDEGDTYSENRGLLCGADAVLHRGSDGGLPPGLLSRKAKALLEEKDLGKGGGAAGSSDDLSRLLETAAANLRQENPVIAYISDPLTGLYNAAFAALKLAEEFKRTRRFGHPLTLVDLDLERRPEEGEELSSWRQVLNVVAGLLLCESRDIDILARTGPSTFRLILPHTDQKGAEKMVERVLGNIAERHLHAESEDAEIAAVAGIAEYRGEGVDSIDELERRAREALESARRAGAGCCRVWADKEGG